MRFSFAGSQYPLLYLHGFPLCLGYSCIPALLGEIRSWRRRDARGIIDRVKKIEAWLIGCPAGGHTLFPRREKRKFCYTIPHFVI
jgi:hypothetical protein